MTDATETSKPKRVRQLAAAPVLPDATCGRTTVRELATMNTAATGAADGYWVAGELLRRMADAIDVADQLAVEALGDRVTDRTVRAYGAARARIALGVEE